jgi:putative addiction module component (TIGR02574 family)
MQAAALHKLPVADRLALIDEIWASIPEAEIAPTEEQLAEARSRLRELRNDPKRGLTYEQLKKRLG